MKKCPLYREINLDGRDMGTKPTSLPDVLLAAYIDAGMSTREIADLCGLTDGTVQQKIYKLLKKRKKGDEPCQD